MKCGRPIGDPCHLVIVPTETPETTATVSHTYHPVLLRGDELQALIHELERIDGSIPFGYSPLGIAKMKLMQATAIPGGELSS